MSAEKDSPPSVNDENASYYYSAGRMSPSSWDDSNEEQSDEEPTATYRQDEFESKRNSFIQEIPTEDRRQSSARVRRRTRSSSSVFDAETVKIVDSSESCDESVSRSPENYRDHQIWNDWDSEEIIFGIDNYLNQKRLSLIRSRRNQSDYVSVLNGEHANQTEVWGDNVEFRSNLNGKLSKIIEVEESKSNTSLKTETPCSARHQTDVVNELPVKYSSADKYVNLTDEDDSDDSDMWRRIRSKIRQKNSEYAMNYDDSQYVTRSLNFFFDDKPPDVEENGFVVGDKKQVLKNGKVESEACVGGARENRNDERADESITPSGVADLSGRTLNKASSKETVDLGLGSLFSVPESPRTGRCVVKDDTSPRSGREAFMVRESSNRSVSKRVRGNHTISLSTPEKLSNYMKDIDQTMYLKWDRERYQANHQIPIAEDSSKSRRNSPRTIHDSMINNDNWTENVEDNSNGSSPTSFRSKILLDLDLSDNEDKCSTMERIIFGDSPQYDNKSVTPRGITRSPLKNSIPVEQKTTEIGKSGMRQSVENAHQYNCDQYGIGDSKWNADEAQCRKIYFPQDRGDTKYERPDTKPGWGSLLMSMEETNHVRRKPPKENVFWIDLRDNPSVKCWKPEDSISKPSVNNESSFETKPNVYSQFSTTHTKHRRIQAKKRKRENAFNDDCLQGTGSHSHWGDKVFDRRGNWLVNTVTRREDMLTRSKRWVQTFIVTKKRGRASCFQQKWNSCSRPMSQVSSSRSTSCFCNIFKQFVNVFLKAKK